ncbi:MAG TPA: HdeD family acid-resistance protein [Solirubrobacterales bacterium]|nr:HdeD family acid-resistance protein [Solirubrobacterales bacterium]
MEYGGASLDPEIRAGLARSWKALMTIGIAAIVLGCIAIIVPEVASVGTAIFIGWILLIVGAFLVAAAFSAHSVGSLLLRLLWAAITVIVGLWLIVEPHNGTLTLTFVLGVYFLFMGVTRVTVAFLGRGQPNAGWVGLSGVCGLLIGILVLAKFPSSADWAIGLLVGIDLIFAGWTLTSVAMVGKELSRGRAA